MPTDFDHAKPGQHPNASQLTNIPRLVTAFYSLRPDAGVAAQRVAFGTSGHRGSAFNIAFNEDPIAAITQAICDYRRNESITGPLFLAQDTHALSQPAFATALEVLVANNSETMVDTNIAYT